MTGLRFWKFANRGQGSFNSLYAPSVNSKIVSVFMYWIAAALITIAFGEEKSDPIPHDTGSDFLWKKLETRVDEISHRLDGVLGVAVLDLMTDSFSQC